MDATNAQVKLFMFVLDGRFLSFYFGNAKHILASLLMFSFMVLTENQGQAHLIIAFVNK